MPAGQQAVISYPFEAIHRVSVGTALVPSLGVLNWDTHAVTYQEALHTYHAVQEIAISAATWSIDNMVGGVVERAGPHDAEARRRASRSWAQRTERRDSAANCVFAMMRELIA